MNNEYGWVKLHRDLIDSTIFDNPKLLKVWIWCLCKASHTEHEVVVGKKIVKLQAGQFVFGRLKAAEALKMNDRTVYDYMKLLQQMEFVKIHTTTKFSIITVQKWKEYQCDKKKGSKQYGLGYHNGRKDAEAELVEKEVVSKNVEVEKPRMMLTIKEASELTGLSYNAIRQMCIKGEIPFIKAGSKYLINKEKLLEYLKAS